MKTEPTNDDRILSVADLFLSLSIFKKVQVWQPSEKETDTHTQTETGRENGDIWIATTSIPVIKIY